MIKMDNQMSCIAMSSFMINSIQIIYGVYQIETNAFILIYDNM